MPEQKVKPSTRSRINASDVRYNAPDARVRSRRSSAPGHVREPVLAPWETEPTKESWRDKPLVIGLAVFAWLVAVALLLTTPNQPDQIGFFSRVLTPLIWALAAGLTFIPLQTRLALPDIGWQGVIGWGLLGYMLAFVPAPTGSLFELPDLPVYLLFFLAAFYATVAAVMPFFYLLGQRIYKLRVDRFDHSRAQYQAYGIGLLVVATLLMAAMRVLSLLTFSLMALIVLLIEMIVLLQARAER